MAEYTLKKVANMTECTEPTLDDYLYLIQSGLDRRLKLSYLTSLLGSPVVTGEFTNLDLVAGQYIISHNKGTFNIVVTIYSPDGVQQPSAGVVTITSDDVCILNFGSDITEGTWWYVLQYYAV